MDGRRSQNPVPSYLAQSILCTMCCCLPLGIPAIVFSSQVNPRLQAGDIEGARKASRRAKLWLWWALGTGLLANLLLVIMQALSIIASSSR